MMVTEKRYAPANTKKSWRRFGEKLDDLSMANAGKAAARKSMIALMNNSQWVSATGLQR